MDGFMLGTVHKNGSSYAIVLPKQICKAFNIQRGDQLAITAPREGVVELRTTHQNKKLRTIKY